MRFLFLLLAAVLACSPGTAQIVQSAPPCFPVPNDTTQGTANNYLAKLSNGRAVILAKSDTTALGVVVSGGGTSGTACIATSGTVKLALDGGTTANDTVQISSVSAGAGHDVGQVATAFTVGTVLKTNTTAGVYDVVLSLRALPGGGGGGGGNGGSGGNATSILGVTINSTPLIDGQTYVYSGINHDLEPVPVPLWRKFTVGYTALTGFNALTGQVTLWSRPARQKVCGISMYTTAAFTAAGLTSFTVTVGDSNSAPDLYTPTPMPLRDNGQGDYNILLGAVGAGSIQANFTAIGANLSSLTAGSVDLDVCLASTP